MTAAEAPGAVFRRHLESGTLALQVCGDCGRQIYYPRTICPGCGSVALQWRPASGRGTVYSTTTVRQKPERGGDYNIAIVELEEGARLMSRVQGIAPSEVRIGQRVKAVIEKSGDDFLVLFTLDQP